MEFEVKKDEDGVHVKGDVSSDTLSYGILLGVLFIIIFEVIV